ncbi:MAG TPA: hypothetical protein VEA69_14030, partial [Tepidisphaeraceae bacterium]|nr:hypothetical protein [Tepidisphaeraceae bacterium]
MTLLLLLYLLLQAFAPLLLAASGLTVAGVCIWYAVAWFLNRPAKAALEREANGMYPSCGFDLRATPTPAPAGPRLAVCPECGRDSPDAPYVATARAAAPR